MGALLFEVYFQTSASILKSFFEKYSKWVESLLSESLSSEVVKQELRAGRIQASHFEITAISVPSAITLPTDGGYYLQVSCFPNLEIATGTK